MPLLQKSHGKTTQLIPERKEIKMGPGLDLYASMFWNIPMCSLCERQISVEDRSSGPLAESNRPARDGRILIDHIKLLE